MMEDSTLHQVYDTLWALPCTVLSRSWSILRDLGRAGSDLGSVSHDSTLTVDPCSLTLSDERPRHVQSVLHPQLRRPSLQVHGGGGAGEQFVFTGRVPSYAVPAYRGAQGSWWW